MKKTANLLITFVCALCIAACALFVCACNGKESGAEGQITYSVTVKCDNFPMLLNSVKVQLKDSQGDTVGEKDLSQTDNVASFVLDSGNYDVELVGKTPNTFASYVWSQTKLTAANPSATMDIVSKASISESNKKNYSVTVQYPDGSPVTGIYVQVCGGPNGSCILSESATDSTGKVTYEIAAGEYEIHIKNYCPAGYTFDDSQYRLTEAQPDVTVKLTKTA